MYDKEPDCMACMPVELRTENELPFRIYMQSRRQLIMAGMDGTPIDVSIPAVKIVMDMYGVGDNRRIFDSVLTAVRSEITAAHERREADRRLKGR